MPTTPGTVIFGHRVQSPIGIAAGPLPSSRWIEAYARLGYGLLTYGTVRTAERPAAPQPNLVHCDARDPAVSRPAPRPIVPGRVTWAVSLGFPSAHPDVWRADVARAKSRLQPGQILLVSVMGTAAAGAGPEELAEDYALCGRWAADAGADVVEVHLACPGPSGGEQSQMLFENPALAAYVVDQVRRSLGTRPLIAKLGATRSPRALHELATRLAPRLDGFILVDGLRRKVVKPDGTPAFPGDGREATLAGAGVWEQCQVQVEEMLAWRKAGAWNRALLAVGGLTTVGHARDALNAGADAAMVATAALVDPLIAARFLTETARA
jgi:dihydroorotate dehydrogenase (NAD+) catalytic subunit